MRGFQEIKGQSTRLVYDRELAHFVLKIDPHPFLVRRPAAEAGTKHNGDGTGPARAPRC